MAIVINGSGTVTGLAVGGLPDDTVDEGSLANSINTSIGAKLPLAGGTVTGDVNFGDNVDANFGADADLKIYHDASNSYIDESGTGYLLIRSNRIRMKKYTGEDIIDSTADGSVKIFHDNAKKFETSATGVTVTGAIGGATNLGKVLQVINVVQATEVATNGDTYADTGLTANITPSSTSSKILFFASNDCTKHGGDTSVAIRAYRGSTEIGGTIIGRRICDTDDSGKSQSVFSFTILDSPSSTSQLTYKTQYNNTYAAGTVRINAGSGSSSMTLMEIGA